MLSLWAPVAAWCAVIFLFSSIPHLSSGFALDWPLRKLCHMLEYGVLFALTRRALSGSGVRRRPAAWALLFCVLYAASDEWHQSFIAGRHGSPWDVGVDTVGAFSCWAIYSRTSRRRE